MLRCSISAQELFLFNNLPKLGKAPHFSHLPLEIGTRNSIHCCRTVTGNIELTILNAPTFQHATSDPRALLFCRRLLLPLGSVATPVGRRWAKTSTIGLWLVVGRTQQLRQQGCARYFRNHSAPHCCDRPSWSRLWNLCYISEIGEQKFINADLGHYRNNDG